jgi:hypothetical protein
LAACSPTNFKFEKASTPKDGGGTDITDPCLDGCTNEQTKTVHYSYSETIPNDRNVDILFVDDNSGSMAEEQANMGMRFPTFMQSLKGLNWQIGITTTDVTNTGANGHLLTYAGTNLKVINPQTPNAEMTFDNTVQVGTAGSGDERGIYAANQAINLDEDKWIRPAAHLAIIIMSDEDERSDGTNLEPMDMPDNLVSNIKTTLGATKTYSVHAIVTRPNDKVCLDGPGQSYGNIYASLVTLTNGILGDICAPDYGVQLNDIGTIIQNDVDSLGLKCPPINGTVTVSYSPAPAMPVTTKIDKDRIFFTPALSGGTIVKLAYDCAAP